MRVRSTDGATEADVIVACSGGPATDRAEVRYDFAVLTPEACWQGALTAAALADTVDWDPGMLAKLDGSIAANRVELDRAAPHVAVRLEAKLPSGRVVQTLAATVPIALAHHHLAMGR